MTKDGFEYFPTVGHLPLRSKITVLRSMKCGLVVIWIAVDPSTPQNVDLSAPKVGRQSSISPSVLQTV